MLTRKSKLLLITVLIASLALLTVACGQETEEAVAEEEEEIHPVEVVEAEMDDLAEYVTKVGNSEAIKSVLVSPQLQEEIAEVHIKLGDRVAKGDKLITLDDQTVRNQLKQARAGVKVAEATLDEVLAGTREEELIRLESALEEAELSYEQVKKSHQRQERLFKEGLIAEESFEQSEINYVSAKSAYQSAKQSLKMAERGATEEEIATLRAQLEQARVDLEGAKITLKNTEVISPIEGQVVQNEAKVGELASGEPLVKLADLEQIKVTAKLSERNISRIEEGQEVEIYFAAVDGTYTGVIDYASPVQEEQSRRFPVEVVLDNAEEIIKAGMYAQVEFMVASSEDQLIIPQRALLSDEEGDYIFVVENEQAVRREVETGLSTAEEVVVLSGIEAGEQVIIRGHQERLLNGDSVEIVDRGGY
ncbi:efflux RND transporter periplasmic adaptor subunit [Fuchsiella alkaliacetigena]|uniref:efflux RND transporter periplasmic adaptor subunit n=1 Tax=Fuchsiella alkaliacetigena TaxID=957042 RepID=UPI00200B90E5|nr:efflux RND transporter periplasmic adaptor subunit [Fuchsiella alkaliacetigena]MCK8823590.1 efflux RND transporter periplasmic adaptor subunit [Fuchsiella alkaliacetigena]